MRVNYIAEMNAFFSWVPDAEPSANAQLLWHALMGIANSRGEGGEWPEKIRVSNRNLLLHLPYSEDSLARAREELCALGRIRFVPGSRAERPGYMLCLFCPADDPQAADDAPAFGPQKRPLLAEQPAEPFHTENKSDTHTADEEECCRQDMRAGIIAAMYAYVSAAQPREAAVERLVRRACQLSAPPALVREAIRQAAENNAANPMHYAEAMLEGWTGAGYRTIDEVNTGQLLRQMAEWRGRAPLDEPLPEDMRDPGLAI